MNDKKLGFDCFVSSKGSKRRFGLPQRTLSFCVRRYRGRVVRMTTY